MKLRTAELRIFELGIWETREDTCSLQSRCLTRVQIAGKAHVVERTNRTSHQAIKAEVTVTYWTWVEQRRARDCSWQSAMGSSAMRLH